MMAALKKKPDSWALSAKATAESGPNYVIKQLEKEIAKLLRAHNKNYRDWEDERFPPLDTL